MNVSKKEFTAMFEYATVSNKQINKDIYVLFGNSCGYKY